MPSRRNILLVQLPIPPVGPEPIRGNVPLAAGYLKMFAEARGLAANYRIDILPAPAANTLSDRGLVQAILAAEPWMVGFTCYLWNIQRTLWIAERLKEARPGLQIVVGGPEITADNDWVLRHEALDFAVIGEGEQTFCDLLRATRPSSGGGLAAPMPGLFVRQNQIAGDLLLPPPRRPLANLDQISSPYLAGILDAADEQMLLLETIRGCIFKCKFCYYPKSYDGLYFLSEEKIVANLEHAQRRGAREVVLLDPTLNQRRDFPAFLRLLTRCNPDRQFTYFGELRAEGITAEVARLLHEANFTEVEIGLQSIDPLAMELMDRKNNLRAFERGARAMLDLGIKVKVDLIIGLPGDTIVSVRRGLDYIHSTGLYSDVQVFNLAVLPGTSFRQEANMLGLEYQDRPPYYVLKTPTLDLPQMFELMEEAQELFETEFDPLPEPSLEDDCTQARSVSEDEPTQARSVSEDEPPQTRSVSEDEPPQTRSVSEDEPTQTRSVSEDEPTQTRSVSEDEPTQTRSVSEDEPPQTRSVSEDEPTQARSVSEEAPPQDPQLRQACPKPPSAAPSLTLRASVPATVNRSTIDLDRFLGGDASAALPPAAERSQAFDLRLRSDNFDRDRAATEAIVAQLLEENPFTTLQLILEPTAEPTSYPRRLSPATIESLLSICFRKPTYLDRFYSVLPGRPKGAKRLIVALPARQRSAIDLRWTCQIGDLATIAWRGETPAEHPLHDVECIAPAGATGTT